MISGPQFFVVPALLAVLPVLARVAVGLFDFSPVRLAIVRKYQDANGAFVGELYRFEEVRRRHDTVTGYRMIGASLDTLPLGVSMNESALGAWRLDTGNDFLAPMGLGTIRVGSADPRDNDAVRREVGKIWKHRIRLTVQNRLVEQPREAREDRQ